MGLPLLIAGLVLFLGTHAFVAQRRARASIIAKIGEVPWKGILSVLSLLGIVLIVQGYSAYRAGGMIPVWDPPRFFSHITLLLMWASFVLFLAAYLPGYIKQATKHPMLLATKVWAFSHLLANGDLGSIILFGAFLAWAVYARIALKRRELTEPRKTFTPRWTVDAVAVVVGTALYLAFAFLFHALWIGVPVIPGR